MGKIQVLSKNISDKIAAGEVVERPASVIKELLENAVDAGATNICVEIKNGGISYMRVTDNGVGMTKEDAQLCVIRHATSKIATEEDLSKIATLGFRGEALSSIAAVSKLEIYTKAKGEDTGTHMTALNGEVLELCEAGCPDGTTVVVRELFCTVPARMKFLKKDFTEGGYIEDIVSRLALSHPEISLKFINNGKEVLFTPGDNLLSSAIYAVYGKDVKNAMIPAEFQYQGITVSGMCGKASVSRANRNMETFFVNGRYIKSPLLARATEEAYKNELMVGKFPACVLSVTLPPEHVDINIHPTKLEAKFADEKSVYHTVYWAVKNALYAADYVPTASEHRAIKPQFARPQNTKDLFLRKQAEPTVIPAAEKPSAESNTSKNAAPETVAAKPSANPSAFAMTAEKKLSAENMSAEKVAAQSFAEKTAAIDPTTENPVPEKLSAEKNAPEKSAAEMPALEKNNYTLRESAVSTPQRDSAQQEKPPVSVETFVPEVDQKTEAFKKQEQGAEQASFQLGQTPIETKKEPPVYRIVGQVLSTYIIVEKDGKMLMVDQHAAHERLRYEDLLLQYQNRQATSQMMLCPEVIDLSATEFACFLEHEDAISDLGFLADAFGSRQIIVRGTPGVAGECDAKSMMLEILGMLLEGRKRIDDELASKMLYRIACRGAVKANAVLTQEEMKTLLDRIFSLNGINTCPHGRPITVEFTKSFIEKQFKRIV